MRCQRFGLGGATPCASLPLIQPGFGFVVYDGGDSGRGQLNTRTNTPAGIYNRHTS